MLEVSVVVTKRLKKKSSNEWEYCQGDKSCLCLIMRVVQDGANSLSKAPFWKVSCLIGEQTISLKSCFPS